MLFGHLTFVWTQDIKLCFYISVLTTPCSGISQFPDAKKEKRKKHKATTNELSRDQESGYERKPLQENTHTLFLLQLTKCFFWFSYPFFHCTFSFSISIPPHSNRALLTDTESCICTCAQKATSKMQPYLTQTGSKMPKGARLTTGSHLYFLSAAAQFWLNTGTQIGTLSFILSLQKQKWKTLGLPTFLSSS